ncbi:hypothetical protein KBB27_04705 [Patescibacteria group bacterium]|nr:hypothetical protein [Patescibacteria group bacterium]
MTAERRAQIARLLMVAYFQEKGFRVHGGLMKELAEKMNVPEWTLGRFICWLIMMIEPQLPWGKAGTLDIQPSDDIVWIAFKTLVAHKLGAEKRSREELTQAFFRAIENTTPELAQRAGVSVDECVEVLTNALNEILNELPPVAPVSSPT